MNKGYANLAIKQKHPTQWEAGSIDLEAEIVSRGLSHLRSQGGESNSLSKEWTLEDAPSRDCTARIVELTEAEIVDDEAELKVRRGDDKLCFSLEGAHYVLSECQ
jgi:hypothetical protein